MARHYTKSSISKNGRNYYLQFHISDWMRKLPAFQNFPVTKKNFKETLRTPDYSEAFKRAEKRLIELQIKSPPIQEPLALGHDAFRQVNKLIETISDEQLESYHEQFLDLQLSAVEPAASHDENVRVLDQDLYDHASNAILAIKREYKRRSSKFFDDPYPYPVTLLGMADEFMAEMSAEGQQQKTVSKVKNAARRFLDYREVKDIQMRLIKPKMVTDYVKAARLEERSHSTFKNDIHYLANVYRFAIQQGYLETSINPFKDVPIKNFKEAIKRRPFTRMMLDELMKASEADKDLKQLIQVSYYTGMRLNEAFTAKVKVIKGIYCFDVAREGGKTKAAQRTIPIHPSLLNRLSPDGTVDIFWSTKTATALGKRFGRMKDKVLKKLDTHPEKRSYCHHSFRHGFTTMLLEAGYQEIEMADLTGHERSNMGRTEAGRTYFSQQSIAKLVDMVASIPDL